MGWVSLAPASLSHREELTLTPHTGRWEVTPPQPGLPRLLPGPMVRAGLAQGRFSSDLGFEKALLKISWSNKALACHRLWGLPLFPEHKPIPKALTAKDSATAGRDSTHTSNASSWSHPACTAGTEVPGPARPLLAA